MCALPARPEPLPWEEVKSQSEGRGPDTWTTPFLDVTPCREQEKPPVFYSGFERPRRGAALGCACEAD